MRLVVAAALLVSLGTTAYADEDEAVGEKGRPAEKGTLGVGIIVGEPTGICAKIYLAKDRALQIAAGSAFISNGLQLHADYVFHPWILQDRDSFVLPVYIGPGVRVIDYSGGSNGDSHFAAGIRGVAGLLFDFKSVPLDAFLEIAGVFEYDFKSGNGAGAAVNFGGGVRYYF
ncbi:MAG TPA: hypothetical protein VGC41_14280 [Kofleriaceae bacterium]